MKNSEVAVQKGIGKKVFPMPNEIFPDGKVKYFLRKYEILLTQYEICPLGILRYHFVMIEIQMGLLYDQLDQLLFSVPNNQPYL